jgi:tRNA(Ile)-lysidine synthase
MSKAKSIALALAANLSKSKKYLVAVSGGMDSMALLHGLVVNAYRVAVAHCNYQLRGEDSNADQKLVQDFCTKWQIDFYTKNFDTLAFMQEHKVGIQEGARMLRYSYFQELCEAHKLAAVLTAHHAADQLETVMMNICRGTGLDGLTGIKIESKINNQSIIRPLLHLDKQLIQEYIAAMQVPYRDDASNAKTDYLRNQMRLVVIPAIENADPRFTKTMQGNIDNWTNVNTIYQAHISKQLHKACSQRGRELYLHLNAFKKLQPISQWIYEAIKPYGFSYLQSQEVMKILDAANGKMVANDKYRIVKQDDFLVITNAESAESNHIIIEQSTTEVAAAYFTLHLNALNKTENLNTNPNIALLDATKLEYPLLLRKWKEGDYFYPLGMPKKKKVARFLIDNKIPLLQKEKTYVLESNHKIVWVVGMRIDNRVKITDSSKEVLRLEAKWKD